MLKKIIATSLVLCLVFGGMTVAFASTNGIQYGQVYGDTGTVYLTDPVAAVIQQTGAHTVRVGFRLGNYTTDTAAWYSVYDGIINSLTSRGLTVIGMLGSELMPGYTQSDWCANNKENGGTNGSNTYLNTLIAMCQRIALHFNNKVMYWEVWNEPNAYTSHPSSTVYTGGSYMYPSNFQCLLTGVYSDLKYYNSDNCTVISGGLFGHSIGGQYTQENSGANYLTNTYSMGRSVGAWDWDMAHMGTYPYDGVGQHLYITQGGTVAASDLTNYCNWVRNAYTAYEGTGTPKKTYITEYGWTTTSVTEAVQSTNIATSINTFNSISYIAQSEWFFLQDNVGANKYYGLFRSTGLTNSDKKAGWATFNSLM